MIVLITGASRGIGQGVAKLLAQNEDITDLVLTATSMENLENTVESIQGRVKVHAFALNLANSDSISALIDALSEKGLLPDVLINNAGMTRDSLAIRLTASDWDSTIMSNLTGTFQLTQACYRAMLKKRHGRIINLSSVVARTGNVGQVNYVAAKAALEGMTRSLALEGARRGVTVNAVAPGIIDTDMTRKIPENEMQKIKEKIPMQRLGSCEDVASMIEFIMSSSYVTGQVFHVNGGLYLSA